MAFHTRAVSALMATAIIGGCTAFIASEGELIDHAEAMVSEITCYVVKSKNNEVVLYKEGEDEPLMVFDTDLSRFPMADRELLKNGIRIRGIGEVMRLLEDLDIESISVE